MITEFATFPENPQIEELPNNDRLVTFCENLVEVEKENEIAYRGETISFTTKSTKTLKDRILANYDAWLLQAKNNIAIEKPTSDERVDALETLVLELGGII